MKKRWRGLKELRSLASEDAPDSSFRWGWSLAYQYEVYPALVRVWRVFVCFVRLVRAYSEVRTGRVIEACTAASTSKALRGMAAR